MNKVNITDHPEYYLAVPRKHRFVGTKFSDLFFYQHSPTYFLKCRVTLPQTASIERLLRAHSISSIDKIYAANLSADDLTKNHLPGSTQLRNGSFLAIEGTYQAAKLALQNGIDCHFDGGTHHARQENGFGFCVFKDLAYTALNLIEEDHVKSVLILDAGVHPGDGSIHICTSHPSIYTCSIHSESNFPFEKKRGWLDMCIPAGSNDDPYLIPMNEKSKQIDNRISPDIVLYDAGIHIFREDGLGNLNISRKGKIQRDRIILEYFNYTRIPVTAVIGAGYTIVAYALEWRHSVIFAKA